MTALTYYDQENEYILNRTTAVERELPPGYKFHKIPSGYYQMLVREWVFYALGNGLSVDETVKEKLGDDYDMRLLLDGVIPACHGGVSYAFWNYDRVVFFPIWEGFPLLDERTSDIKVFIRFWQVDPDKPMYVELFTEEGITEFATGADRTQLERTSEKPRPYKTTIREYETGQSEIVDTESYSEVPIFPLYVNDRRISEFTEGLQRRIDAIDAIRSSHVDGVLQNEGVKWLLQNFGGDDFATSIANIAKGVFPTQGDVSSINVESVEEPYNSKEALIGGLENNLYAFFMTPNPNQDGRVATATEIKAANQNKNIKSDILEWCVCRLAGNLLRLQGVNYKQSDLSYKRRSVIDDTEMTNNISTMLSDGYIDEEFARYLSNYISSEDKEMLDERMELAAVEEADGNFPLDDEEPEEIEA